MANPKLEFFRFKLKHKSGSSKTFRNFMLDNRKCKSNDTDKKIFGNIYAYFMDELNVGFVQNDSLHKVMTLIRNTRKQTVNKFWDKRPQPDFAGNIISGVVNGGAYGKERIVSRLSKKNETNSLNADQPVLQYYYIFLYLPLDHNEGFVMIHTDTAEESISNFVRKYIATLFSIGEYQKPTMIKYVPIYFQDEYRKGAIVTSMIFQTTYVDNQIENDDPIKDVFDEYDIKINIIPKGNGDRSLSNMEKIRQFFTSRHFGIKSNYRRLEEFEKCTVNTKNADTHSNKSFDWNLRDADLTPVIYLKDKVTINRDGTVDLDAINIYCKKLFKNHIIKELRPDRNVEGMV